MTLQIKNKSKFNQALLGISMILLSFLSAVLVVLFPIGFVAKAAIIIAGLFAIILAWRLRSKTNKVPDKFVFGLMMFIVTLSVAWPRYVFFGVGSLPKVNPQTISVMVGLALICLFSLYSPAFSKRVANSIKNGGVIFSIAVVWLLWRFFANFLGEYPIISTLEYLRESLYLSSFLLFGVVIASYDNGPKIMVRLIILAAFFVGVAGLVEAFQQKNIFVGFASQDADGDLAKVIAVITSEKIRSGAYRVQSTFDHPIAFAQFFAALMPLTLYGVIYDRKRIWRVLSFVIIPITLLAILKSGSRAGIVSFVIVIGFLGVLYWFRAIAHGRISKFVAIIALPLLAVGIGFASYILQELASGSSQIESGSSTWRIVMINSGIDALWDSPLWGFGQGMALSKAGVVNPSGIATIDSYLLSIAIDSGYIGLLLLLILIITFGYKGFKYAIINKGEDALFVGFCVAGALALVTTFTILSITSNMTFLWLLITATFPYLNQNKSIKFKEKLAK